MVELKWFNKKTVYKKESIEVSIDIRKPGILTISGLSQIHQAKDIGIEIYIDDKLMSYVIQPLDSSELLK